MQTQLESVSLYKRHSHFYLYIVAPVIQKFQSELSNVDMLWSVGILNKVTDGQLPGLGMTLGRMVSSLWAFSRSSAWPLTWVPCSLLFSFVLFVLMWIPTRAGSFFLDF